MTTTKAQATILPFGHSTQTSAPSLWLRGLMRRRATPAYQARAARDHARYDAWLLRHCPFEGVKLAARLDRQFERTFGA